MDDHNGSLKPPVPPRSRAVPRQSKQHVVPAPQNKDTNKSSRVSMSVLLYTVFLFVCTTWYL